MFKNGVMIWMGLGCLFLIPIIFGLSSERHLAIGCAIFWFLLAPIAGWINESTDHV